MQFFKTLRDSIYGPKLYSSLKERSFSSSIKYFIKFAILIAIINLLPILIRGPLPTPEKSRAFIDKAATYYPDELVITITNGKASTNVKEPYMIPAPDDWKEREEQTAEGQSRTQLLENILVIDTTQPFTLEAFKAHHTLALLTKDALVVEGGNQIRILPIEKTPDTQLTKQIVSSLLEKIKPYTVMLLPLLILFLLVIFIGIGLINLIYLLFGALLIWGLTAILKTRLSYGKCYQIGLHAITLSILVNTIFGLFMPQTRIPIVFTLLMLVVVLIHFWPKKKHLLS